MTNFDYNSFLEKLCYKVPSWDYQQWMEYTGHEIDEYTKVVSKAKIKTELFPYFMGEVFTRLLNNDNLELCYDTDETYSIKKQEWEDELKEWEENKQYLDLEESEYVRIFGEKPEQPKKLLPKNEINWAVKLHDEININDEFKQLMSEINSERQYLKRWILSGVGAMKFGEICSQKLPQPKKQLIDPERLRELVRELRKEKEAVEKDNPEEAEEIQKKIDKIINQGKEAIVEYNNYAKELSSESVSEAIKAASIAALAEVEAIKDTMDMQSIGWGTDDINNPIESEGITEKLKNAKKLLNTKNFKKIMEMVGRLKLMVEQKRKSSLKHPAMIKGVKTGNDLMNLLPVEYGRFAHKITRRLFLKDYTEKALLEYDKESNSNAKKGPIVMLVDNSASMAGNKEIWSKAVAVAYLMQARVDSRDFYAIHFDTQSRKTYSFPKGKFDSKKLEDFVKFFSNGNTNWMNPLNDAVRIIESQTEFKKADIIMITDDECQVSDNWVKDFNQKKEDYQFTAYSVMIGTNNKKAMESFMDKIVSIPNLSNDQEIVEIF